MNKACVRAHSLSPPRRALSRSRLSERRVSDTRQTRGQRSYLSPNAVRTRTQADANLCPKPPGVSLRCISSW